MSKHTPGPWVESQTYSNKRFVAVKTASGLQAIAEIQSKPEHVNHDSRLIAAAPELLEALKVALIANELTTGLTEPELDQVRHAIAKAEGEL